MSITDELREWAARELASWKMTRERYDALTAIADRIDAEHQKACDDAWDNGYEADYLGIEKWLTEHPQVMEHHGWIRLPKDADGEPFHIGELVDEMLPFGGYAAPAPIDTMELSRGASGYVWMVKLDAENRALISPKLLRHHAPTVEDVLREFADLVRKERVELATIGEDAIAEYASKLRLAEGADA